MRTNFTMLILYYSCRVAPLNAAEVRASVHIAPVAQMLTSCSTAIGSDATRLYRFFYKLCM